MLYEVISLPLVSRKYSHLMVQDQLFIFETKTEKNQSHKTRLRPRLKELWSQKTRPIPRLMICGINFRDQDWNGPQKTQLVRRCQTPWRESRWSLCQLLLFEKCFRSISESVTFFRSQDFALSYVEGVLVCVKTNIETYKKILLYLTYCFNETKIYGKCYIIIFVNL